MLPRRPLHHAADGQLTPAGCAAVPVYNDLATARSELDSVGSMRYTNLHLMDTCDIMGVNIVVTGHGQDAAPDRGKLEDWRKYICVANVHTTVTTHEDPDYQGCAERRGSAARSTAFRCRRAVPPARVTPMPPA